MQKTIEVITKLAARGVIQNYAIVGAVAALAYIEPTLTEDLDILVSLSDFDQRTSGLLLLTPIETALAEMGYSTRSDVGILIEGWPVQFLPVASPLDQESLDLASDVEIASFTARVTRPEHLVAKAISIGRLKDLARAEAFLDQDRVDLQRLKDVIMRFDLASAWKSFCLKAGRADPLALS